MSDTGTFIKFCEPAHQRTPYIAELWNTLSSFAYCVSAIHFLYQVNAYQEAVPECFPSHLVWRFRLSAFAWFVLGLGSAAFHAYQTLWAELWDEIGMLIAILSVSYCLFDLHPLTTSHRANWFYGSLVLFMATTLLIYVQIMYHPFFALCFMVSALIPALITVTLPMRINTGNVKLYQETGESVNHSIKEYKALFRKKGYALSTFGDMSVDKLFKLGIGFALLGYVIWHIDQRCVADGWGHDPRHAYETYWYYWTHPLWHTFTALGTMFFFDALLKIRIESYVSPLVRRTGTGSFIPNFSFGSSLRIFFKIKHTS